MDVSFTLAQSSLRVSEAMDMLDEFVNQAAATLEQAVAVANAARDISGLPRRIDRHLVRLTVALDRIDSMKAIIRAIRQDLLSQTVEPGCSKGENHGEPRLAARLTGSVDYRSPDLVDELVR